MNTRTFLRPRHLTGESVATGDTLPSKSDVHSASQTSGSVGAPLPSTPGARLTWVQRLAKAVLFSCYRLLWWPAAAFAVARLLWRGRREPGYRAHIGERFGLYAGDATTARDAGCSRIWIHAVSVGETRAAQALVERLLHDDPQTQILFTHMTPAGRHTSELLFDQRVMRCYLPYDLRFAVDRFLRTWKPDVGMLMEGDVWPTLIARCRRAGVPLMLANARLSERSWCRMRRVHWAMRDIYAGLNCILAQSRPDAERLRSLGGQQIAVTGNLKFDIAPCAQRIALGQTWRAAIGARPVWVAASTRAGEETLILQAWKKHGSQDGLLILVPRHPARADKVARLVVQHGLTLARRTQWHRTETESPPPLPASVQVLLGDSLGELVAYYSAADVAFIGGSLLPHGGQNLIEACAVGLPVLFGPHMFNFEQVSQLAVEGAAARTVADATSLIEHVQDLMANPALRASMANQALRFACGHQGSTARTVDALRALTAR